MLKDYVLGIQELYNKNNEHWAIETCDLIVLCYELLLMEDKDIDNVFERCLRRFGIKLKESLEMNDKKFLHDVPI